MALNDFLCLNGNKLVTILDGSIPANKALSGLHSMNTTGVGLNMNLFGIGLYTKNGKNFWSVDVNFRADAGVRVPYEFFDFIKRGNNGNFGNLGCNIDAYIETGFTYSFPVIDNLYIGVRGKFLTGIMRATLNFDEFNVCLGEDRWYGHAMGSVAVSGIPIKTKSLEDGTSVCDFSSIDGGMEGPSGYGFGVDVGAAYDVLPNLRLSLAVNDIGFIGWSKRKSTIGQMRSAVEFEGVEVDVDGGTAQPNFDFDDMDFIVTDTGNQTKALRASINAGGEYNFLDRRIGLGVFYCVKLWEYQALHNVTASANFRPLKWLHLSGSYSFLNDSGHSVGLAINVCPRFINLFVATDMLLCKKTPQWIPITQGNMNLTFGLSVPLGKSSSRNN